jgi:hypothetical protein
MVHFVGLLFHIAWKCTVQEIKYEDSCLKEELMKSQRNTIYNKLTKTAIISSGFPH